MSHEEYQGLLLRYFYQELEGAEKEEFEAHLYQCQICQRALQELSELSFHELKREFKNQVPLKLKVPEGEVYFRTEAPRGEMGIYLVSEGGEKPYRAKIRTGSFSNLSVFPEMVKGVLLQDLVAISGSMDFILPEIDR